MGSQQESAERAEAPQQELPPELTRKAACPYFSFTTSFSSMVSFLVSEDGASRAERDDGFRLDGLVSRAALGVEKAQQFAERIGVG